MADDQATQLTGLVLPCGQCPTIGPETSKRLTPDIMLYFHSVRTFRPHAPHKKGGSYRFVRTVNGQIVAGLQVMSQTGAGGTVANIYCRPESSSRSRHRPIQRGQNLFGRIASFLRSIARRPPVGELPRIETRRRVPRRFGVWRRPQRDGRN
jgi:hypothetical protein